MDLVNFLLISNYFISALKINIFSSKVLHSRTNVVIGVMK